MSEEKPKKFTFGEGFQKKIIVNMLFDEDFLSNNHKIIKPIYFGDYKHHWLVEKILTYYNDYSSKPTQDVLYQYIATDSVLEEEQKEKIILFLDALYEKKEYKNKLLKDYEFIQKETHRWCWQENIYNALRESIQLAEKGEYDKVRALIENAHNDGQEVQRAVDYDDLEGRANEEFRKGIVPFPWEALNKRIGGGLGEGEFMAFVGGMGSGKSLVASNIAVGCRRQGKTVVLYSLELSANYIRHRTDTVLTQTPIEELEAMKKRDKEEYKDYIRKHINNLDPNGKLLIQYIPTGSTVNDIKSDVKWLQAQGHDIDMVIIDYLDKMNPIEGKRGKQDWQVFEEITLECRDFLCREMNMAGVGMVQGNTSSLDEKSMSASSTSGGARRLHPADVVLGYARPPSQKSSGRATATIIKNRFGKDGISMPVHTEYSKGWIEFLDEEYYVTEEEDSEQSETDMKKKLRDSFMAFETKREMRDE